MWSGRGGNISQSTDVAVIGAGPYGLSIAAHLRALGVDHAVFGKPLETWRERMPAGMSLKSDGFASSLSSREAGGTLGDWCAEHDEPYHATDIPVPLETFVAYGLDFQRRFVPQLDERTVSAVAPEGAGFRLTLSDGETLAARRVVVAVGISHFEALPEPLADLPHELLTHACEHRTFERFSGRDVTVLGAGSSAVEVAVSLAAAGARPRLLARREKVPFASPHAPGPRSLASRLRHPSSGLGNSLRSRIACDAPDLFRVLPGETRLMIVRRHLGPSSPHRLKEQLEAGCEVLTGQTLAAAQAKGSGLALTIVPVTGGSEREIATEHMICATGYRADVDRLGFLDPAIRGGLKRLGGSPRLSPAFESSVPNLYFAGLAAAASFGPLMRFMYGDEFAARRIGGVLARRR